jgi:hypothetical protein
MNRFLVEIGTLHLDGLAVPAHLAPEFGRRVETELSDLFRARGLPRGLGEGRVPAISPAIDVPANLPPRMAPAYVAKGLFRSLGGKL